jgi:hypothetical protein
MYQLLFQPISKNATEHKARDSPDTVKASYANTLDDHQ